MRERQHEWPHLPQGTLLSTSEMCTSGILIKPTNMEGNRGSEEEGHLPRVSLLIGGPTVVSEHEVGRSHGKRLSTEQERPAVVSDEQCIQ